MPLTLSSVAYDEKNRLSTDSRWLVCLDIYVPGLGSNIRVVNDNQDLTWKGETWVSFPFEIEEITDLSKNEIPTVSIKISNVSRAIESYLVQWDAYQKANGYAPIVVEISVVNTFVIENMPDCDAEVTHTFELKKPKTDAKWATFTLGATNIYTRRFPLNRILKNHCRYRFKGADGRCGYAGTATECNHTLTRCRELDNSERFGGAPGVGYNGLKIS